MSMSRTGMQLSVQLHRCPRDWSGEPVVIVASGPSTARVDLSLIRGIRCLAVSNGCRAVPDADVLLFGGQTFARSGAVKQYDGPLIVMGNNPLDRGPFDPRMVYMRRAGPEGLATNPEELAASESSVMLAINYAVHRGCNRIILLGCDGKPGLAGERRFGSIAPDNGSAYVRYREQEMAMATQIKPLAELGVGVVNCSPGTALTIYKRADLEDAIAAL